METRAVLPHSVWSTISARAGQSAERSCRPGREICATRDPMRRWSSSPLGCDRPCKFSHRIACVHRDGKGCKPAEGTLLALWSARGFWHLAALGKSSDSGSSISLCAPWRSQDRRARLFSLVHPWPLSLAPSDVSMNWKLQVFDPNGIKVATDVVLSKMEDRCRTSSADHATDGYGQLSYHQATVGRAEEEALIPRPRERWMQWKLKTPCRLAKWRR